MAKEFLFHCGASVLVDDAYATWECKAKTVEEAFMMAMEHAQKSSVLDSGTVHTHMDQKDLARELGNIASENDDDWTPVLLVEEIEKLDVNGELYGTLEWIVSNANKKGEI